ncbi:leucine-rich repeat domain-containing protein, partial [Clostridium saccharoperbutylacetonicum]
MKVAFEDTQFENDIRKNINKLEGDITEDDLINLTELSIGHYSDEQYITSIEGIQYCENLKKLELIEIGIRDISLLKNLKKLEYLDLSNNYIKDINEIRDLNLIEYLNLSYNPIENVDVIEKLPNLKHLNLFETQAKVPKIMNPTEILSIGIL